MKTVEKQDTCTQEVNFQVLMLKFKSISTHSNCSSFGEW